MPRPFRCRRIEHLPLYRSFSPGRALVRNISESVIIPIAGMFLTFIACYDLIQLIIEHNMNNLLIDQEASQ